jgi:hypothetical protein
MDDIFPAILFGWPTILTALSLCIAGVWLKRSWLVIAGALLSLPFDYYLTGSPLFRILGILMPVLLLAAAASVKRRILWLAWILLLPFSGIVIWIGASVLRV